MTEGQGQPHSFFHCCMVHSIDCQVSLRYYNLFLSTIYDQKIVVVYDFFYSLVPWSLKLYLVILLNADHAEGLVEPNFDLQKTVTGFRYPRACKIRKYQIERK
jgi:hypothetical protein